MPPIEDAYLLSDTVYNYLPLRSSRYFFQEEPSDTVLVPEGFYRAIDGPFDMKRNSLLEIMWLGNLILEIGVAHDKADSARWREGFKKVALFKEKYDLPNSLLLFDSLHQSGYFGSPVEVNGVWRSGAFEVKYSDVDYHYEFSKILSFSKKSSKPFHRALAVASVLGFYARGSHIMVEISDTLSNVYYFREHQKLAQELLKGLHPFEASDSQMQLQELADGYAKAQKYMENPLCSVYIDDGVWAYMEDCSPYELISDTSIHLVEAPAQALYRLMEKGLWEKSYF